MAASTKASKSKGYWRKIKSFISPKTLFRFLSDPNVPLPAMVLLLAAEIVVSIFVIQRIKYTEIDWVAYMQEVEGVINETYDYTLLKGDTGPLVYPAGFVYIYGILYYITDHGANILTAQYIFAALYIVSLIVVFHIYRQSKRVPPYVFFFMCCASYRIHSIYILRMFNDPVAMLFLYVAVDLFLRDRWSLGCLIYSFAVSVKMNVLLFAPALLLLLLVRGGVWETAKNLMICAVTQVLSDRERFSVGEHLNIPILLGLPFLLVNPVAYLVMSFNLGRQFFYVWTVNWRLISEELFLNRYFQLSLLACHILALLAFTFIKWKRYLPLASLTTRKRDVNLLPSQILLPLFTANFIGMCFSRSLHYQFYVWYFHGLHYLLWSTRLPVVIRILLLGVIELSWNTYPSTVLSSSLLHICHLVLLVSLWYSPDYTPQEKKRATTQKVE